MTTVKDLLSCLHLDYDVDSSSVISCCKRADEGSTSQPGLTQLLNMSRVAPVVLYSSQAQIPSRYELEHPVNILQTSSETWTDQVVEFCQAPTLLQIFIAIAASPPSPPPLSFTPRPGSQAHH
ncbi:hypothetical protein M758_8G024000 [Ceratodon purpureus]|uniref:Uncharacterized protein n=1 Tax=Ceratodon purpureus TaxID=3225 RepID=A0A8T0GZ09_CERPU|nr:hypothetical protein KC19_8G024800 [Ceratodon purpureus]KAG0607386.1 hypothetical protein M758_8G024000 [Ceratodon purpureus]